MSRWLNSEVLAKILEEMTNKDGQHNDEDLVILNEHGMDICCFWINDNNSKLEYVPYTIMFIFFKAL